MNSEAIIHNHQSIDCSHKQSLDVDEDSGQNVDLKPCRIHVCQYRCLKEIFSAYAISTNIKLAT